LRFITDGARTREAELEVAGQQGVGVRLALHELQRLGEVRLGLALAALGVEATSFHTVRATKQPGAEATDEARQQEAKDN
jgi:hypothetical protein